MKVTIDKISNNKNTYESQLPLVGHLMSPPVQGHSVYVIGGDHGGLVTSKVVEVMKVNGGWEFKTLNSTYRIDIKDK